MTERLNRESVQSNFSDFSFENGADDSMLNTTPTIEKSDVLSRNGSMSVEALTRENTELKAKLSEQQLMINSLKHENYELQQQLDQLKKVAEKSPIHLELPPRSAQRARHFVKEEQPKEQVPDTDPEKQDSQAQKSRDVKEELNFDDMTSPDTTLTPTKIIQQQIEVEPEPKIVDPVEEAKQEEQAASLSTRSEASSIVAITTPIVEQFSNISRKSSAYSSVRDQSPVSREYSGRIMSSPIRTASGKTPSVKSPSSLIHETSSSPVTSPQKSVIAKKLTAPAPALQLESTLKTPNIDTISLSSSNNNINTSSTPATDVGASNNNINNSNSNSNGSINKDITINNTTGGDSFNQSSNNIKTPMTPEYPIDVKSFTRDNYESYDSNLNLKIHPSTPQQQQQQQQNLLNSAQKKNLPTDVALFVEPTELSTIRIEILNTINGNLTRKTDDPQISILILDRQSNKEMWRIKKKLSSIVFFDTEIRPLINSFALPPIPEKLLFLSNIPVKVDLRRQRLRDYFVTLLAIPHLSGDVCYKISRFLSLDIINLLDESNTEVSKDGYLLRKGKGLGNTWKARYCCIDNSMMNVFESKDGSLLEIIKLNGSQIGRQPDSAQKNDDKNAYRHAFAIMEPKKGSKSNSFIKHVFCAETDHDRDLWINELLEFTSASISNSSSMNNINKLGGQKSARQVSEASQTILEDTTINSSAASILSNKDKDTETDDLSKEIKRNRKRSFFPFSKKVINDEFENFKQQLDQAQSQDAHSQLQVSQFNDNASYSSSQTAATPLSAKFSLKEDYNSSNIEKSLQNMNLSEADANKFIFKNDLAEAFKLSNNILYGHEVPSIIYRCLTYMNNSGAIYEEGIFRLNGSSSLIKQLREKFDREFDVDFNLMENKPDVNSIAGLLKLYLRELPTSILTNDGFNKYQNVVNTIKDQAKVAIEFKEITRFLPIVNKSLLFVLFKFLNQVMINQDSNKMNLRNLCIVFSPTLNVTSEMIIPFLVDFKCIFENGSPIKDENRQVLDLHIPTF